MIPWKDLKLTDDYLFSQIMREEDFCKLFLEMLMGIKVEKVVYLEAQKEVNLFPQAKGIRMDVYLEGDGEIYNIEMQTVRKTGKSTTSKCRRCERRIWLNECAITIPPSMSIRC